MKTFVIAEAGSTWELDLEKLERLAHGVKAVGADALKLQWTSSGLAMAQRRGLGEDAAEMYYKWLQYDPALLVEAKGIVESKGLEFMCSTFLIQDIQVVAPLVSRFKVSAFESQWREFVDAHGDRKEIIISLNPGHSFAPMPNRKFLHCISKYPTPIKEAELSMIWEAQLDGWSDHCANKHTGGWAVMCGAKYIEVHVRSEMDRPSKDNPDYPHSLPLTAFALYVDLVRGAELAL